MTTYLHSQASMTMMLIMAVAVGRQEANGAVTLRALSLRLNLNMLRNKQPGKYINESHPSFTAERMAFVLGNTTKFPSTTKQLRRSWWCSFVYVEEHFATRGAHCFMIVFQSKMMRRIVLSRTQRLSSDSPTASLLGRLPQPTRESHFRLHRQPGLRMK